MFIIRRAGSPEWPADAWMRVWARPPEWPADAWMRVWARPPEWPVDAWMRVWARPPEWPCVPGVYSESPELFLDV